MLWWYQPNIDGYNEVIRVYVNIDPYALIVNCRLVDAKYSRADKGQSLCISGCKHENWHKYSLRATVNQNTMGQAKIQHGRHFSRWPPAEITSFCFASMYLNPRPYNAVYILILYVCAPYRRDLCVVCTSSNIYYTSEIQDGRRCISINIPILATRVEFVLLN